MQKAKKYKKCKNTKICKKAKKAKKQSRQLLVIEYLFLNFPKKKRKKFEKKSGLGWSFC